MILQDVFKQVEDCFITLETKCIDKYDQRSRAVLSVTFGTEFNPRSAQDFLLTWSIFSSFIRMLSTKTDQIFV